MGWSYSGDPANSDLDAIRFEIQDTDPNQNAAVLLTDEEIQFALDQEAGTAGNRTAVGMYSAAARCSEVLSRRFAMQADEVVGSLQVTYSAMAKTYAEMASGLRLKAQGSQPPFAGGQSISGKRSLRSDCDRVQPAFERGQFRGLGEGGRVRGWF